MAPDPTRGETAGVPVGVPVGVAAARLGVTTSTLRSWGTRYGVVPSLRTKGGHRRYSEADLARLDQVQAQIRAGAAPAAAAAAALTDADGPPTATRPASRRRAGPGGRVLAVPGADDTTRGLARAAGQLDLDAAEEIMLEVLRERGVVRAWDELMRPVLTAVGRRWAESGEAIEVEHVLSEASLGALRRRRVELPAADDRPPVLLATAPGDQHTLPLHVLALGLSEQRCPARVIGAQVPVASLATAVRRIRPAAVFVSCVVCDDADPATLVAALPRTRPATVLVLGGDGWPADLPPGVSYASGLREAVDLLGGR
ncbi:MerR family transcriptional regulator [Nocardioides rubriscoriae]|uniref:MerR family transcriptional regulator n=1 Tax=Nocardioides rubriscoriae TaxID=642762 RepID=UPI0011E04D5A|nr:MerR family transcriptional regulator [Nocardioides rubriscoriae]